ncbi:LysR family transcriptional regulator [Paracoccus suum]|uniref:LysR family transcriptional regulator n=1 Tax=Paracoccus suum TaxID=2259340 RepID=A0A344PLA9_9RHOB|nr:LysR family transcriptional regulator [Paracoccus suum]AXC50164.1 LysR family transcriptional regulator [Paracoccus suum]
MIDRLEILIALARERHFGRAAAALGISQPSLSSGLRTLEDQLGVQLVRRGSRFQGLTPEGERALDWARRIVGEARAFRADMRALREGITGELRLGIIPTAAVRVAALTGPFLAANPRARLAVVTLSSDAIIAGIDSLELDAAITYQITAPARLLRLPLYTEDYCLVEQGGGTSPATWAEAATKPLALLSRDMRNRRVVEQMLAASGAEPVVPRIESNSTLAILGCVAAGPWAAILPQALGEALPLPAGVTARRLPGDGGEAIALVTRDLSPQPPLVAALLAKLR